MERGNRGHEGYDRDDRGPAGGGMRAFPSSNGKYHREVDELDYIVPRSGRFFEHDDRDSWTPGAGPGQRRGGGRGFGRSNYGSRPPPRNNHHHHQHPDNASTRPDYRQDDRRSRAPPRPPRIGSKVVAPADRDADAHPSNPGKPGESGEARTARDNDRGRGRHDDDRGRGRHNDAGASPQRGDPSHQRAGPTRERERSPVRLQPAQPPAPRPVVRSTVVASGEVKVASGDYRHRNARPGEPAQQGDRRDARGREGREGGGSGHPSRFDSANEPRDNRGYSGRDGRASDRDEGRDQSHRSDKSGGLGARPNNPGGPDGPHDRPHQAKRPWVDPFSRRGGKWGHDGFFEVVSQDVAPNIEPNGKAV